MPVYWGMNDSLDSVLVLILLNFSYAVNAEKRVLASNLNVHTKIKILVESSS